MHGVFLSRSSRHGVCWWSVSDDDELPAATVVRATDSGSGGGGSGGHWSSSSSSRTETGVDVPRRDCLAADDYTQLNNVVRQSDVLKSVG